MDFESSSPWIRFMLLLAWLAAPAWADGDGEWRTYWKNGTRIESSDGNFKIKIGGRIQADWNLLSADDELEARFGEFESGGELRRARLYVEGVIYQHLEFKAQYDFAGGETQFRDMYVGLTDLGRVGGLRIGHYKEPFGLEELTSSNYITFVERSAAANVFAPSRNMGFSLANRAAGERMSWAVGLFQNSDNSGSTVCDDANFTGRLTGLPIYKDDGRRLLHLGAAVSDRSPCDDRVVFEPRPDAHLAPRLEDLISFSADALLLQGLELAWVGGPFWVQSEWARASADSPTLGDPELTGFYLQTGFFLTGDNRVYKPSSAAFDRLQPRRDFKKGEGAGAWEIAVRYAHLDLIDAGLSGDEIDTVTLALNWYLNSASRVMLNYVRGELEKGGEGDFVLLRFQVSF